MSDKASAHRALTATVMTGHIELEVTRYKAGVANLSTGAMKHKQNKVSDVQWIQDEYQEELQLFHRRQEVDLARGVSGMKQADALLLVNIYCRNEVNRRMQMPFLSWKIYTSLFGPHQAPVCLWVCVSQCACDLARGRRGRSHGKGCGHALDELALCQSRCGPSHKRHTCSQQ